MLIINKLQLSIIIFCKLLLAISEFVVLNQTQDPVDVRTPRPACGVVKIILLFKQNKYNLAVKQI